MTKPTGTGHAVAVALKSPIRPARTVGVRSYWVFDIFDNCRRLSVHGFSRHRRGTVVALVIRLVSVCFSFARHFEGAR